MNAVDVINFTGKAAGDNIQIGYVPTAAIFINKTQWNAGAGAAGKTPMALYVNGATVGAGTVQDSTDSNYQFSPIGDTANGLTAYNGDDFVGLSYGAGLSVADGDECSLICFRGSYLDGLNK